MDLKAKRERAGLTRKEISIVLGRTGEWLRLVETGKISISQSTANVISQTIDELMVLRKVEVTSRADLFADRKLPRRISR